MQTFLPYSDFRRTAAVLDASRLGKQRVETLQILRALTFDDYGWANHPAVLMWRGHIDALVAYGVAITERWTASGFGDTVLPRLVEFVGAGQVRSQAQLRAIGRLPPWLGVRALHRSHQAALVRKDPEHYGPLFPKVAADLPYVWPAPASREVSLQPPISGWVVRVPAQAVPLVRARGLVGIAPDGSEDATSPLGTSTRTTKRRRQLEAFVHRISPGDRVVVPVGDRLLVGVVDGSYAWHSDAPGDLCHARRVRWVDEIARADLARPVHLQDPRVVFALHGEPVLHRLP